jgi:DNA-binding transcriptional ArsR family regulator
MRPQRDTFEIEDVRVLEVLNNPVRLRLMHQMMEPTTARDLARTLNVPVTRLYYHLNLLEEVGVIEVVETRKSGAMLQRVYRTVAADFAGEKTRIVAIVEDEPHRVKTHGLDRSDVHGLFVGHEKALAGRVALDLGGRGVHAQELGREARVHAVGEANFELV